MRKIYDKRTGKLIEVQLYRTEQFYLMRMNNKSLKALKSTDDKKKLSK